VNARPQDDHLDAFDRDIAALLAVEPSPEFQARIRARADEHVVRASTWWRRPLFEGVAAVAVVAIALVVGSSWRETAQRPSPGPVRVTPAIAPTPRDVAAAAKPPSPEVGPPRVSRQAGLAPQRIGDARRVVVAPEDIRGFQLLLQRLNDGTLDERTGVAAPFLAEARDTAPPIEIRSAEIAPIVIAPVTVSPTTGETE
jgi:hypothetical protein